MRTFPAPTQGLPFFSVFYPISKESGLRLEDIALDLLGSEYECYELDSSTVQDYYCQEFGTKELKRLLFVGKRTQKRMKLVDLKLSAETWQQTYSESGQRQVNIDPGHVGQSGEEVDRPRNAVHRVTRRNVSRPPPITRHPYAAFVRRTFAPLHVVVPPPAVRTVVAEINHDRVVRDAQVIQLLEELADVVVALNHAAGVLVGPRVLLLATGHLLGCDVGAEVHAGATPPDKERLVVFHRLVDEFLGGSH